MIEGTNPNGQIPATTNDEQTIPAGAKLNLDSTCVCIDLLHVLDLYRIPITNQQRMVLIYFIVIMYLTIINESPRTY